MPDAHKLMIFNKNIIVLMGIFVFCVMVAFVLATQNVILVAGAVVAVGLFTFGFLSPRMALYLLILSMLLSPEIGARDISGKGFTIRFEDLLLVIMGFTWLAKSAIFKNVGLAVKTRLNIPILIYLLVSLFATAWGTVDGHVKSPLTGFLFVMKYFEYFIIYFFIINNIESKSHIRNLFGAIFITYIIVLIVGLSQIPKGIRITAPFEGVQGEPNTLGGYLIMMFSINVMFFFNVKKNIHRIALAITAILCVVALLHTLSRASWLGFAVMYIFLILFAKRRNILIFTLIVTLLIGPFVIPRLAIKRFLYTFLAEEKISQKVSVPDLIELRLRLDSSTQARLQSIGQVLKDLPKRPFLGYGVTGYQFLDAQIPRILIECGIIGVAAFIYLLWITGTSLFGIWKRYPDDPLYNTLSAGTLCAFFGLLVHSIGTNTFIIVRIMEPFWCLVGLNLAIPIIEHEKNILHSNIPAGLRSENNI